MRAPTMMSGYFQRPDLNRAAFYRRDKGDQVEGRFYRTGDLVWQDDDGLLHFVGRKDRQVKLRGFRLELDEVEAVMTSHPAVKEAACVLSESAPDDKKLEVSVTLNGSAGCDKNTLLRHAADHLPYYGVPEHITILEDFPRTSTGNNRPEPLKQQGSRRTQRGRNRVSER